MTITYENRFAGYPYSRTLTAPNAIFFTAENLPESLSISSSGVISGMLQQVGRFAITVLCRSAGGTSATILDLTVNAPPTPFIASADAVTHEMATAFSYQITASSPIAILSYGATSLPTGLSVNTSTGLITGTPTSVSNDPVITVFATISATNANGTGSLPLTFTLQQRPTITSSLVARSYSEGVAISPYTITATKSPTSFGASSLPPGLTVDSITGVISGTPSGIPIIDTRTVLYAGGPGQSGNVNGDRLNARFQYGEGMAFDAYGNCFVCDTNNHCIRKISYSGEVTTYAGSDSGVSGYADGVGTAARFSAPSGICVGFSSYYILVSDTGNNRIRIIYSDGRVATLAGSGATGSQDGDPATASFYTPVGIAPIYGINGGFPWPGVFICDENNETIRRLDFVGNGDTPNVSNVSTVAGSALQAGATDGPAAQARFWKPHGIAYMMLADGATRSWNITDRANGTIRRLTGGLFGNENPTITTLAGNSTQNRQMVDGVGSAARFYSPMAICAHPSQPILFVTDSDGTGSAIRQITNNGTVSLYSGSYTSTGYQNGSLSNSRFDLGGSGLSFYNTNFFGVLDSNNRVVRAIVNQRPNYYSQVTATNSILTGTGALDWLSSDIPIITSTLVAPAYYEVGFGYQITSTSPAPVTYGATNLPSGLSVNPLTGLISGTPTTLGTYSYATITATNMFGTNSAQLNLSGTLFWIDINLSSIYFPETYLKTKKAVTGNGVVVLPTFNANLPNDPRKLYYTQNNFQSYNSVSLGDNWYGQMAYGNNKFLALGSNSSFTQKYALTSTDGLTWIETPISLSVSNNKISTADLVYFNNKFILSSENKVGYSTDGINWTVTTRTNSFTNMVAGDTLILRTNITSSSYCASKSSDGINWTDFNIPGLTQAGDIVYGNGVFIVRSTTGGIIYVSLDNASTWQAVTVEFNGGPDFSGGLVTELYRDYFRGTLYNYAITPPVYNFSLLFYNGSFLFRSYYQANIGSILYYASSNGLSWNYIYDPFRAPTIYDNNTAWPFGLFNSERGNQGFKQSTYTPVVNSSSMMISIRNTGPNFDPRPQSHFFPITLHANMNGSLTQTSASITNLT